VKADVGSDINAALDQRPLSERAMRFLAVTAAGLLALAAWQTQTLQVNTYCACLLLQQWYSLDSCISVHEPLWAGRQLACCDDSCNAQPV